MHPLTLKQVQGRLLTLSLKEGRGNFMCEHYADFLRPILCIWGSPRRKGKD